MKACQILGVLAAVVVFFVGCGGDSQLHEESEWSIDQRSYNLGGIGAFAEMVGAGVKRLALSSPLDPAEMDMIVEHAERIVHENGAQVYRDTDFLVTDLFAASLTEGKHVLVICFEATYQEYQALKDRKQQLVDSGRYEGEARLEIARSMGELLSYSDEKIEALLAAGAESEAL